MSKTFADLIAKVNECGTKNVAVAVAQDSAVLEAVKAAKERKIADAVLVGDEKKIREIADSLKGFIQGTIPSKNNEFHYIFGVTF